MTATMLVLEDEEIRTIKFERLAKLESMTLQVFKTAKDMIDHLKVRESLNQVEDLTYVYLDHDLGHYHEAGSGQDVTRYLVENAEFWTKNAPTCHFFVHSLNTVKAPVMVSDLRAAGYRAFRRTFFEVLSLLEHKEQRGIRD